MKSLATLLLTLLPFWAEAQFQSGQIFIDGSANLSLNDTKYLNPNYIHQSSNYGHDFSLRSGYFTRDNKAIGWTLNHSLTLNRYTYQQLSYPTTPPFEPRALKQVSFGGGRFVEYYKPVFGERLALYVRPSVGITYTLHNADGLQENNLLYTRYQTNTFTLGVDLSAGIAWKFAPRWALYGGFAFSDPIRISGGWKTTEGTRTDYPSGQSPAKVPTKSRGGLFDYAFSPALSSGGIALGFRYFYKRKASGY